MGEGGFVGEAVGEEVHIVHSCEGRTTTIREEPDSDGIVRFAMIDDNGLSCHSDGGSVEIQGLMDGGWYWINDELNSAVSPLLAKDTLGNMMTEPTDPGGVTVMASDYGSFVKHERTGRVGIIPHILPAPEAAPAEMCGPFYWADDRRYYQNDSDCMLGDGSTKVVLTADTTDSLGRVQRVSGSVHRRVRNAADNEVRIGFAIWGADGQGHITTETATSSGTIKGHDIAVARGHAPAEPFTADFVVALIEGSGHNLNIGHADIRVDPARVVTVPGDPVDREVTKMRPVGPRMNDADPPAIEEDPATRRLEAGYYMGDMGVAQCMQRHDAHENDPSRNAVNAFKGSDGGEVLVLNDDYTDSALNLDASGTLQSQQQWIRAWHNGGQERISIVQVVDDNDTADNTDDDVTYDIPEVVCEMEEYMDTETETPDRTVVSTGGIIIGPAASTHCRSGRSDVATLFIGVTRASVRANNPEIIPSASTGATFSGTKYAAYTTLNVMCPSSSANQAHHASLNGGLNLVPHTE